MIPVRPFQEPASFDKECRKKGRVWLAKNRHADRPHDYWTPFKPDLARAFKNLCGYSAMYEPGGTVDHFQSWKSIRNQYPELAYEWGNFRYCSGWINSSKQTVDDAVLDPFQVRNGWFEILLPSLQLVVSDAIPARMRKIAEFTINRLRLRDDERIIRQREAWYKLYQEGKITLAGLDDMAPLLAVAIRKQQQPKKKRPTKRQTIKR